MLGSLSFQKVKDIYTDEFGNKEERKWEKYFVFINLCLFVGKMVKHSSSSNWFKRHNRIQKILLGSNNYRRKNNSLYWDRKTNRNFNHNTNHNNHINSLNSSQASHSLKHRALDSLKHLSSFMERAIFRRSSVIIDRI